MPGARHRRPPQTGARTASGRASAGSRRQQPPRRAVAHQQRQGRAATSRSGSAAPPRQSPAADTSAPPRRAPRRCSRPLRPPCARRRTPPPRAVCGPASAGRSSAAPKYQHLRAFRDTVPRAPGRQRPESGAKPDHIGPIRDTSASLFRLFPPCPGVLSPRQPAQGRLSPGWCSCSGRSATGAGHTRTRSQPKCERTRRIGWCELAPSVRPPSSAAPSRSVITSGRSAAHAIPSSASTSATGGMA